mmetsp:Transcript_43546/g.86551  ORF Transcript_43546/g.86551 Transcript_43546/m.86551 type:complete len:197 (+) Transcript_43546:192-782(+)
MQKQVQDVQIQHQRGEAVVVDLELPLTPPDDALRVVNDVERKQYDAKKAIDHLNRFRDGSEETPYEHRQTEANHRPQDGLQVRVPAGEIMLCVDGVDSQANDHRACGREGQQNRGQRVHQACETDGHRFPDSEAEQKQEIMREFPHQLRAAARHREQKYEREQRASHRHAGILVSVADRHAAIHNATNHEVQQQLH